MLQHRNLTPAQDIDAQQAFEKFFTPPRKLPSEEEQKVLEQADVCSVSGNPVELPVFSWGKGSTVLLVHGWGGYGVQLSSFVKPFISSGYRVLTFDAPAHGRTAGTQTNGFEFAEAIKTIAEKEGPFDGIIAHSLGAMGTTIALNEGVVSRCVVLLGAACWLSSTVTTFSKSVRLSNETEEELRRLLEGKFGSDVWQRASTDKRAASLRVPALLFHDLKDRRIPCEESIAIARAWYGAQLIQTSGLGHQRILRDEQVIRQTVNFIKE